MIPTRAWTGALVAALACGCSSAPRASAPVVSPPELGRPGPVAADVATKIAQARRAGALPALVVGIVPLDGDWSIEVQGQRAVDDPTPVTTADLFHLGSAAKPMTADLVAMLVAEGRLRWSATVRELVPDLLPPGGGAFADATLRQLLAHEAGHPRFDELSDAEWQRLRTLPGTSTEQRATVLRELLRGPAAKPIGTRSYSNAGYLLAGYVAEQAAGEPFERLRRHRLLAPLGMSACREGWPRLVATDPEPLGHEPGEGAPTPVALDHQPAIGAFVAPGGDLVCPPAAIARYLRWHLRAIAARPQRPPLPLAAVLHGHDPAGATPLGWGRSVRDDGTEMQPILGSLELFSALLALDVTHAVGYFALTNVGESATVKAALVQALKAAQQPLS